MPHVFLSGNQRSGKTLVQLILASHPDITISPGTKVIGKLLYAMPRKEPLSAEAVRDVRATMQKDRKFKAWRVDHAAFLDGFDRYVGKTPDVMANDMMAFFRDQTKPGAKYIGNKKGCYCKEGDLILRVFPGCKLVYLLRDGRGAVSSMLETQPEHDVYSAALTWTIKARRIRELSAMLPNDVFVCRYEALVQDPEKMARDLCRFLELPYAPEMLRDYRTNDAIRHTTDTTHPETYQAITTNMIDEWKTHMTREQIAIVEGIAGKELERAGYERSLPKSGNPLERARYKWLRNRNYYAWWMSHRRKARNIG